MLMPVQVANQSNQKQAAALDMPVLVDVGRVVALCRLSKYTETMNGDMPVLVNVRRV